MLMHYAQRLIWAYDICHSIRQVFAEYVTYYDVMSLTIIYMITKQLKPA